MSIWNKFSTPTPKKRWMNDSESDTCLLCHSEWTVRLRRHHCRVCYRLVCSNCSDHFVELDSDSVSHRVCDECFPKLDIHMDFPCHDTPGECPSQSSWLHDYALFRIVVHSSKGLFPPSFNEFSSELDLPARLVYCVVLTGDKRVLKTTKIRPCNPLLEFNAEFEESMVVKMHMSKVLEGYLVLKVCEKNGHLIGTCRISLGDIIHGDNITKILLCKELPLTRVNGSLKQNCLPTLTLSVTRLSPIEQAPDLAMYSTRIPYAVDFSQFSAISSKQRIIPIVQLFPPGSVLHHCLFLPIIATSNLSRVSETLLTQQVQLPPSAVIPANEYLLEAIGGILLQSNSGGVIVKGVLLCTTHRLVFIQYPLSGADERLGPGTDIGIVQCFPIPSIASLQVQRKYKGGPFAALHMTCKDSTGHVFICTNVSACANEALNEADIPTLGSSPLRKVQSKTSFVQDIFQRIDFEVTWRKLEDNFVPSIWSELSNDLKSLDDVTQDLLSEKQRSIRSPFSLLHEYQRLGIALPIEENSAEFQGPNKVLMSEMYPYHFRSKWRISFANTSYQTCATYPKYLVVPSAISDNHLNTSSKQRSIERIPALTWIHPENGAALCRSSQPLVGFVESACPEDETLLMSIRACTFSAPQHPWRSPSRSKFPDLLKRRGYRVRRDSLSNSSGCRGKGISDQKDTLGALQNLEANFFGTSAISRMSSRKSRARHHCDRSISSGVVRDKRTTCSAKETLSRSPILPPNEFDGIVESENVGDVTDAWYHPTTIDFDEGVGIVKSFDEEFSATVTNFGAMECGANEQDRCSKSQKFFSLSSETLRQHEKRFSKNPHKQKSRKNIVQTPPLLPHSPKLHYNHPSDIPADRQMGNKNARHVKLRIIDARPYINAKGNALMGKGYEVIERLGGSRCTTLEFANIANIHVVKDSYHALRQICGVSRASSSVYQTGDGGCHSFSASDCTAADKANIHVDITHTSNSSNQSGESRCDNWGAMVSETKWLQHLSSVLRGSLRCAEYLMKGDPVLIHCSDGWDRTSQLTCLAQLLVDPEYRTIYGFKSLIYKDFIAFGHMFRTRGGGVGLVPDVNQESPIFVQFLDAVWQIWRQMPWEFEFTQELLHLLVYCYHSRFTNDFLFNNNAEETQYYRFMMQDSNFRNDSDSSHLCEEGRSLISVWAYISVHLSDFTNLLYKPSGKPSSHKSYEDYDIPLSSPKLPADDVDSTKNSHISSRFMGCLVKSRTVKFDRNGNKQCMPSPSLAVRNTDTSDTLGPSPVKESDNTARPSASDDGFEFRSRTYAGVEASNTLDALKGLVAQDLHFDQSASASDILEDSSNTGGMGITETEKPSAKCRKPSAYRKGAKFVHSMNKSRFKKKGKKTDQEETVGSNFTRAVEAPVVTQKRWVHLITPNFEVNELQLWESVYFDGLTLPVGVKLKAHSAVTPKTDQTHISTSSPAKSDCNQKHTSFIFTTATASAVAYERGLDALCREQLGLLNTQKSELQRLQELLAETMNKNIELERKLAATTCYDTFVQSSPPFENGFEKKHDVIATDFETPTSERGQRERAHSDSTLPSPSISSAISIGTQVVVSPYNSSGFTWRSNDSMNSKFSSSSTASVASSPFRRYFRYHNTATMLFSPPLLSTVSPPTPTSGAEISGKIHDTCGGK